MKIHILSDLHLETEAFEPEPAPGADCLVLAGDIDRRWSGLSRFSGWPVPVFFVPGNHEFDGRDLTEAYPQLRREVEGLGMIWLHEQVLPWRTPDGRPLRWMGHTRWSDFDLLGDGGRAKCQRAARHYLRHMASSWAGSALDEHLMRNLGLEGRAWLEGALRAAPMRNTQPPEALAESSPITVVVTHYAPSERSADPRYGLQPSTASFCNKDDDLLPLADLWIHGHLHGRSHYRSAAGPHGRHTVVVSNPRGHSQKGEPAGFDPFFCVHL
jgi:hypothetical protein